MELTKKELDLFMSINFYIRYESLSKEFNSPKNPFENYSNEEVIKIVNQIGYEIKYLKKDNFFKLEQKTSDLIFTLNINLKYANTELILGVKNSKTGEIFGSPFTMICKLIEIAQGRETEGYLKAPKFSNYEELKKILITGLSIYEDFKAELLKQSS
jgi:hypothetical protein